MTEEKLFLVKEICKMSAEIDDLKRRIHINLFENFVYTDTIQKLEREITEGLKKLSKEEG